MEGLVKNAVSVNAIKQSAIKQGMPVPASSDPLAEDSNNSQT